ncbi:MAG: ABC transporter ATP-binding protein [bacterium]
MIVSLEKITKEYTQGTYSFNAVEEIDLTVAKGEFLAISGPSGSGKSTLLNLIGCIDSPTSGEIIINGKNVVNFRDRELSIMRREEIGFVHQFFNLMPTMSAIENVSLPLVLARKNRKEIEKKSIDLLSKVGLENRMDFLPQQLSGGEMQRVAIARAFINSPSLLLADEPTGNLDSNRGKEILQLISSLSKDKDVTVLMVSHDPMALLSASRRVEIRDGKLGEEVS